MSKVHSRRDFLRFAAFGAAGAALAACQPKTVIVEKEVEKVVKETVVVEKEVKLVEPEEKTVRILMPSWATGEVPFDKAAREFSAEHPGVNVTVQTTFEGWETKVLAQINDGTLEWSGAGIASSASSSLPRWILSGLVQPMDEFIAVSAQEGAQELLTDMLPVLVKASTYEGKFYGMPYSFENISFNWRTDYFGAVGVTEAPETWDDWMDVALKLKEWGADQEIYATSFIPDLDASVGALIYSVLDDPFTEEMLLKWESAEALEALEFYKALVQGGMTPPHRYDGYYDAYMGGKIASLQAQSSRGVWSRFGSWTLLFLTGIYNINRELYEAAKVDGANAWQQFIRITVPLLKPIFTLVLVLGSGIVSATVESMTLFQGTTGGPAESALTTGVYLYRIAFIHGDMRMGYAASMSLFLGIINMIITGIIFKVLRTERA